MKYFPIIIFGYNRPELLKIVFRIKIYKNLKKHKFFFSVMVLKTIVTMKNK